MHLSNLFRIGLTQIKSKFKCIFYVKKISKFFLRFYKGQADHTIMMPKNNLTCIQHFFDQLRSRGAHDLGWLGRFKENLTQRNLLMGKSLEILRINICA